MKYTLEKWAKGYLDKIDLTDVPTLKITETEDNVIITVDDDHDEEFEFSFVNQITLKGMTLDMDEITPFGMKLEEISDLLFLD